MKMHPESVQAAHKELMANDNSLSERKKGKKALKKYSKGTKDMAYKAGAARAAMK